ncbi:MAG: hypothetical protein OCD02_17265 [Spirochaetaceae bacterium]
MKKNIISLLIFLGLSFSIFTQEIYLREAIFTPTAYTPLSKNAKGSEKNLRMGLYGAILYLPREEIEDISGQSLSVFNFNLKWKIIEDKGLFALATGFNGFYPFGITPSYMEDEIFGSMYLSIGKAFNIFNFNGSILYGTLIDVFNFYSDDSDELSKEPFPSLSGNMVINLTDWSDYKLEFIKPLLSDDYLIATSFAVNALYDHICWDLGIVTRSGSERDIEYFVLCKIKL